MNFKNKIILAPMVAVTNIAFRKLCSEHGADIVYSQMIDAVAYDKGNKKLVDFYDEKNVVCQFLGSDAKIIGKCVKSIGSKVQGVDLNLGCPKSNVVDRKCGSYLMKYPKRVREVVKAMVKNSKVPVTVKIRAGYDRSNINAVKIAKLCEKEGVSAIAVHGRARTVNYEVPVEHSVITKVKESVDVPVIGNGDIFSGESASVMFDKTKCDSIMVGRGAIGNPAIFNEIKCHLKGKGFMKVSRKKLFLKFLRYCKKYDVPFVEVKTQAQWLTKGIKHGGEYRLLMNSAESIDRLKEIYSTIE